MWRVALVIVKVPEAAHSAAGLMCSSITPPAPETEGVSAAAVDSHMGRTTAVVEGHGRAGRRSPCLSRPPARARIPAYSA